MTTAAAVWPTVAAPRESWRTATMLRVTTELIIGLVPGVLALIWSAVQWAGGRRQRDADTDATNATATSTIVDGAGALAVAVRTELDAMQRQAAAMSVRLEQTAAELDEVQSRRRTLEAHVIQQDKTIQLLTDSVVGQKQELERQRQVLARVLESGRVWMTEHTARLEALGGHAEPWPREFIEGVHVDVGPSAA